MLQDGMNAVFTAIAFSQMLRNFHVDTLWRKKAVCQMYLAHRPLWLVRCRCQAFFTLSTTALKASGLLRARSARTLRLISIPALWMRPMSLE